MAGTSHCRLATSVQRTGRGLCIWIGPANRVAGAALWPPEV